MVNTGVRNKGYSVEVIKDYVPVVREFYEMESDMFFQRYHKSNGTMEDCINDTCETISDNAEFFLFKKDGYSVGFFVKTECEGMMVLEGFHIKVTHRVADVIEKFWNVVRAIFSSDIYIGIYIENYPAIRHLERNGFVSEGLVNNQGKMFNLLKNKII